MLPRYHPVDNCVVCERPIDINKPGNTAITCSVLCRDIWARTKTPKAAKKRYQKHVTLKQIEDRFLYAIKPPAQIEEV